MVCNLSSARRKTDCQNVHQLSLLFSHLTSLGNSRKIIVLFCTKAAESFQQVCHSDLWTGRIPLSSGHCSQLPNLLLELAWQRRQKRSGSNDSLTLVMLDARG